MPTPSVIRANSFAEVSTVENIFAPSRPVLILYEDGLEAEHDQFIENFVRSRQSVARVLVFRGDGIRTADEFYTECIRVMPGIASYFGRNLNALDEVLKDRDHALAQDPANSTYWVWTNAHMLFRSQAEFFEKLFAVVVQGAKDVTVGYGLGSSGYGPNPAQPVSLLMTSSSEAMKREALDPQSFLHLTRWWQYRPVPPPEPTNLMTIHVIQR